MKKVRKVLMPLFCVLMAVCLCVTANAAYRLTYWYAYELDNTGTWHEYNKISTWKGTAPIKIAYQKLNNNDGFNFYDNYVEAQSTWASALGISFEPVDRMADAQIQAYGGTKEEMVAAGFTVDPNTIANTRTTCRSLETADFNGQKKSIMKNTKSVIEAYDVGYSSTLQRNVALHQMGHALGWHTHSTSSMDVMYVYSNFLVNLTERDKAHLKQVY